MRFQMTPEQFAALATKAGIAAGTDSGIIEQQGVRAHWVWETGTGTLDVVILKKPMLIPESLIASRFRSWAGIS